jgi:hypothetical protein
MGRAKEGWAGRGTRLIVEACELDTRRRKRVRRSVQEQSEGRGVE